MKTYHTRRLLLITLVLAAFLLHPAIQMRLSAAGTYRSIDGFGNNLFNPEWGSTNEALLRIGPIRYADGVDAPSSAGRPGARFISNTIAAPATANRALSDRQLSAMISAWGQFVLSDVTLTPTNPGEPFNIPVPAGDPTFDLGGTGTQVIAFDRSQSVPGTGTTRSNPRQQPNAVTAFLDASTVSGSDAVTAASLRTFSGGTLKVNVVPGLGSFLPLNNSTFFANPAPMDNDAHLFPDTELFVAGDARANQSAELMALHTLFLREHNRIANALRADNPALSDETLYQLARRSVGAEIQAITYNEWIPALLGPNALPAYTGYKSNVNPGIVSEFSTAGFRFGPSLLGAVVRFIGDDGVRVRSEVLQNEAAFNPPMLDQGISPILKFLASDSASELDTLLVNPVRNFVFVPPVPGFDPAARDIQRGRDHGLANYNRIRVAYGLPALTSISQIASDPSLQLLLDQLYGGINRLDVWAGALAEDHVPGTSTGPLIRAMLIDQFTRLRDGDIYFYRNPNSPLPFSFADQSFLENNRSLADLIRLNTAADVIQDNIFFFRVSISGEVFRDQDRDGRHDAGEPGLRGQTVTLIAIDENQQATLVATDVTDANGHYSFTVFDGLGVGNFQVVEQLPAGWTPTSPLNRAVNIPRGETFLDVDFGNVRMPPAVAQ